MSPIWYYAIFLFFGSFLVLTMGTVALVRRRNALTIFFALLALSSAIYNFGYAMEVTRTTPYAIRFWSRFEYMGMPFICSLLIIFVIHFISSGRRVPFVFTLVPMLISVTFLIIRQTNLHHYKFYEALYYHDYGSFMVMTFDKGFWYWALGAYNALCIIGSASLIGIYVANAPRVYKKQGAWLLAGTIVPLLPYGLYLSGLFPKGIDITPAALTLASLLYYVAIFRHDLFTLIPIGRDRLVETMSEAVLVLDSENRVADFNPAAREAFGTGHGDPLGMTLEDAFPSLSRLDSDILRVKDRDKVWELTKTPVNRHRRSGEGFLVVGHDVTEREELVARLERAAREDALTGLLNRHSWDQAVATELMRLSRHGRFGSIIYMDLDGFKGVNDNHGHAAGDSVLKTVGRILKEGVRRPDLVGRYGGEEFVLFLPEIHPEAAVDVAERLRVDLYEAVEADMNVNVKVTGSFGVAGGIITDDIRLEDLVADADKAMYESKQTGKNRVSWNRN